MRHGVWTRLLRVVLAWVVLPWAGGMALSGSARALETKTPGQPQIWYAAAPPPIRALRKWPANDYWRMFDPAADAEWDKVARRLDVFLISMHGLTVPTDDNLRLMLAALKRHNIKLAVSQSMVEHEPTCGGGEGYAPNAKLRPAQLERIRRLGGVVDYVSMDEPLIRGHKTRRIDATRTGCQYSIAEVARRVKGNVMGARAVFPNVQIGATEAIAVQVTGEGPGWAESIREWAEAFNRETGKPLAFSLVAINWRENGWQPALQAWSRHAQRMGIPMGVIYTGAGGNSDESWSRIAIDNFAAVERAAGLRPQVSAIMSWHEWPNFNLPEDKPGTLTHVLLQYLRFRGIRD